ncbi:ricin-type beta-trefoil lectin domain protein [Kitasatospora sp. NPDC005751]|uniref:RICIN domain-containing protein n=1 Tax=unclassified Kitasatospora TaxID=2633591 RepID=UPI0033F76299
MIRKFLTTLFALVSVIGFSSLAVSPAQAVGSSVLWNTENKCATPEGNGTSNGTVVTVWSCTGSDLQKWHWSGNLLVHDVSGKCMTPQGNASGTNGAVLTLWTCDPYASVNPQRFYYDLDSERIWTAHGSKCITAKGNSLSNGTWLTLWTCGDAWNHPQSWAIVG